MNLVGALSKRVSHATLGVWGPFTKGKGIDDDTGSWALKRSVGFFRHSPPTSLSEPPSYSAYPTLSLLTGKGRRKAQSHTATRPENPNVDPAKMMKVSLMVPLVSMSLFIVKASCAFNATICDSTPPSGECEHFVMCLTGPETRQGGTDAFNVLRTKDNQCKRSFFRYMDDSLGCRTPSLDFQSFRDSALQACKAAQGRFWIEGGGLKGWGCPAGSHSSGIYIRFYGSLCYYNK
ncbi:hypothetical protein IE53DRAFT_13788 [Violaceomyces palustris]|uniref:Uncharacterized protein n=1 Tax=Violaceomyces palustris TaxID=1673888 RepID=A0ACD0P2B2_9BASI|nr:hypothetical protein IE53DRAFT_13788 [Violaceomyces palustris]